MSQTRSVDVVSRGYWAYIASAMVEGLDQILTRQVPSTTAIPRRVYVDAHRFFELALEAAGDALPQNPSASIANYIIAADAAKIRVESPADRAQLESRLQRYADLLTKLEVGNALIAEDNEPMADLKRFFAEVQHDAEAEAYERMARAEPSVSKPR